MRSGADWIVACHGGSQAKCLRCGEGFSMELPVRLEIWCAAMKAFCKVHKHCLKPPDPLNSSQEAGPTTLKKDQP